MRNDSLVLWGRVAEARLRPEPLRMEVIAAILKALDREPQQGLYRLCRDRGVPRIDAMLAVEQLLATGRISISRFGKTDSWVTLVRSDAPATAEERLRTAEALITTGRDREPVAVEQITAVLRALYAWSDQPLHSLSRRTELPPLEVARVLRVIRDAGFITIVATSGDDRLRLNPEGRELAGGLRDGAALAV